MDPWAAFVHAALVRHGVGDVRLAARFAIPTHRFFRRTRAEGWSAPAPGVRLHPSSSASIQRRVLTASGATHHPLAAAGHTAAWLHGIERHPPRRIGVLVAHVTARPPDRGLVVARSRWLRPDDIVTIDQVPTLAVPALLIAQGNAPERQVWAWLIGAVHRGIATPQDVLDRLIEVGPVPGRGRLRAQCERLAGLRLESIFQAEVVAELARLGYQPEGSTRWIPTPDGVGLTVDVPLPAWQVAVEPAGDAFHRTREQRRVDRRREAAFAGTDWVCVPVDWRDWLLDRGHVLTAIAAAIAAQQRRGIGAGILPPRPAPGSRQVDDPVPGVDPAAT